jgi:hypothetical protein
LLRPSSEHTADREDNSLEPGILSQVQIMNIDGRYFSDYVSILFRRSGTLM